MVDWYQDSLVIPRQLSTLHPRMTVHLDELDLENIDDAERIWNVSYANFVFNKLIRGCYLLVV